MLCRVIGLFILLLAILACSSPSTPNTATVNEPPSTATPRPTPTAVRSSTPVALSQVPAQFGQPLSSGLSVADVVENALLSVVEIQTDAGYGTGFIINEDGAVVTNRHVLKGASTINLRLSSGTQYAGRLSAVHDSLDIAYLDFNAGIPLAPIAVGDSDTVRVGDEVLVIGFPLASELGQEPTVSRGIVSARRGGLLQTDAPVNPGNSGGPMLDQFGNVIGVITSRVDTSESGRPVTGIGFAIPINDVTTGRDVPEPTTGRILPTPTPFPTIAPPPDLEATKAALDAIDAERRAIEVQRQLEVQATRTALEAAQQAERYAASLEATRVAEIPPTPTPTPRPTSTPRPTATPFPMATPLPSPTPHPSSHCREWEAMVLGWLHAGNRFWDYQFTYNFGAGIPEHPQLTFNEATEYCVLDFPHGQMRHEVVYKVGYDKHNLLPGTYKYRAPSGDDRVIDNVFSNFGCKLILDYNSRNYLLEQEIDMPYGEPFQYQILPYHNLVQFRCVGDGHWMIRIGD